VGRPLIAFAAFVSAAGLAAAFAPSTAVGRALVHPPADGWRPVKPQPVKPQPVKRTPTGNLIARVRNGRPLALYDRPSGRVITRVGAITPFGSQRTFGVVATRRGRWLAVTEAGVGGNRVVWVDARARGLNYGRTRFRLEVDLSSRTLVLRRDGTVARRMTVGVGRTDSPTPTGTFAVTDKLAGSNFSASYGCCILALSAVQANLPAGWTGGNRIAIHGTLSADFGQAASAGCVHARDADLRYLMRALPLGTPVVIRP
jgi:lipoprotein-anchoring transpeptidase ErfK/SrfK